MLEYTPRAGKGRDLPADAPLIAPVEPFLQQPAASQGIYVELWAPERKVIRADLPHPMTGNLKLLAYPAWRASMHGNPAAIQDNPQTGQLIAVFPAGASRMEIKFAQTWDRAVGKEISIGSGVLLVALWQLMVASRKDTTEPQEAEVVPAKAA